MSLPADSSGKKPVTRYRKPRADVFTVLLVLALIAILVGIVCLYFENAMYDWEYGPSASAAYSSALAPDPRPLTPTSSTDALTTVPLFQL